MDNLFEIIVPLIIAAVYFFGNMMSGKSDEDDQPKPSRRPSTPEDAEAAERQRKIQEEIRRKIMERRQSVERGEPLTPVAVPVPSAERLRERRAQVESRRERREEVKETQSQSRDASVPPQLSPTRDTPASDGRFNWDESENAYDGQMEAQLKRIEETKRQAEKLKRQANSAVKKSEMSSQKSSRGSNSQRFGGSVRSQLKDPAAARAAFIYGEVLGQPISQRKQSTVPGLAQ